MLSCTSLPLLREQPPQRSCSAPADCTPRPHALGDNSQTQGPQRRRGWGQVGPLLWGSSVPPHPSPRPWAEWPRCRVIPPTTGGRGRAPYAGPPKRLRAQGPSCKGAPKARLRLRRAGANVQAQQSGRSGTRPAPTPEQPVSPLGRAGAAVGGTCRWGFYTQTHQVHSEPGLVQDGR